MSEPTIIQIEGIKPKIENIAILHFDSNQNSIAEKLREGTVWVVSHREWNMREQRWSIVMYRVDNPQ